MQGAASAVTDLAVYESERDAPGVIIPHPETHLGVRFGASLPGGLDLSALGVRDTVHRKIMRGGQRAVMARLELGTVEAVLGVPASALAGRIVPLAELWGDAETQRLLERLSAARTTADAAAVLERAITERLALAKKRGARTRLAIDAARRLSHVSVSAVAEELGVSERNLRRIFLDTVGVSPKAYARLARFRRALEAAGAARPAGWAGIAADAGYYDQAHLIADFRSIAGATPGSLLGELRGTPTARSLRTADVRAA